jgi:predicted O-methyltransferase YrrM
MEWKNERNAEIKNYICDYFAKEDKDLLAVKEQALKAGLPNIAIPENVGKLIYILTKLRKPQHILEVGTLAGYSTIWLARAAPEARIITLECNPKHASIARENFQNLNLNNRIEIIEADAIQALRSLIEYYEQPFDLIFLDAEKKDYPIYLPYLLQLSKSGTLLLTDNLIPKAAKINAPASSELEAIKTYDYNLMLASYPTIETILVTTIVGDEGRTDALGVSLIN